MSAFIEELWRLRCLQLQRGYRRIWVFHKLREQFELDLEDLKLIASVLGYHPGWIWHQWDSLQNSEDCSGAPELHKPLSLLRLTFPFTRDQLACAYRRMARLTHPDSGGSHEAFIVVNEAYECLKRYLALSGGEA